MSDLSLLFAQKKTLRSTFETQKRLEWERVSENLEDEISQEIVRLAESKRLTVAGLGRIMGTSAWVTAKARWTAAYERVMPSEPVSDELPEDPTLLIWSESDSGWTVADVTGASVRLAVLDEEQAVMVLSGDTELSKKFTSDPEAGYLLWEKATTGN